MYLKHCSRELQPTMACQKWWTLVLSFFVLGAVRAELPTEKAGTERLKADVYYLASDTLEGRGISTPGIELAAQHIRAEFKRLGLKSGTPDGSYYQSFTYAGVSRLGETSLHNVVGVLDGQGALANETVLICAHYDHLGHGQIGPSDPKTLKDRVYHGADDNASGVAVLLELARRFATHSNLPRRRLVFVAFSGEESGLIGSRYYTLKNPLFPLKETAAIINFDMVGRMRKKELGIAGDRSAREFDALLAHANSGTHLKLRLGGTEIPGNSDHLPFSELGVPILFFCTGTHADRHSPTDTADKINYQGLVRVADFSERVIDGLSVLPHLSAESQNR